MTGPKFHERFCEYFLERPDWRVYPNQKWFEALMGLGHLKHASSKTSFLAVEHLNA